MGELNQALTEAQELKWPSWYSFKPFLTVTQNAGRSQKQPGRQALGGGAESITLGQAGALGNPKVSRDEVMMGEIGGR